MVRKTLKRASFQILICVFSVAQNRKFVKNYPYKIFFAPVTPNRRLPSEIIDVCSIDEKALNGIKNQISMDACNSAQFACIGPISLVVKGLWDALSQRKVISRETVNMSFSTHKLTRTTNTNFQFSSCP